MMDTLSNEMTNNVKQSLPKLLLKSKIMMVGSSLSPFSKENYARVLMGRIK